MRISATELDQYVMYCEGEMELDELKDRLTPKDVRVETEAMRFGTAMHEFLENAHTGQVVEEFTNSGIDFTMLVDDELSLPRVREVKTERVFHVDGDPVTLVGKADAVEGLTIFDHKLTAQFDAENYTDSFQWRAYLVLFGAEKFTYNVFECKRGSGECEIRSLHQLSMYRYKDIEADVIGVLTGLVRFLRTHIPERITWGDEKNLPEAVDQI